MFDNVRISSKDLIGVEGAGFKMAMAGLDGGRLNIAACSIGAAQASFEIALTYVKVSFICVCSYLSYLILNLGKKTIWKTYCK